MATLLFGYDVEHNDPVKTGAFLKKAHEVHSRLEAPVSLFLVGTTVLKNLETLTELRDSPWFDYQSHTYSHKLLKTVCQFDGEKWSVFKGVSIDEIDREVAQANEVLKNELGVTCLGLTGPYNYYRGLSDRPDILEVLHRHGIRYVRTYGRNEQDWQPVSLDLQPFWYEPQGYPDMLECNINGWQDCILRERFGWENGDAYLEAVSRDLEYIAANDLVFSYAQHDWSSIWSDEEMKITEGILLRAKSLGIRIMNYTQYYQERLNLEKPAV